MTVRSPFNGPLEMAIRALVMLTEAVPESLDLGRMVLYDHYLLHSADIGGPTSLHPALPTRRGEIGLKRTLLESGLAVLVRCRLASLKAEASGLRFEATERAESFVSILESSYATALRQRARWVAARFAGLSDDDVLDNLRSIGMNQGSNFAAEFGQSSFDFGEP